MSSLTPIEKKYLEETLGMHGGYVLDFTNRTFEDFFRHYGVAIYDDKYQTHGDSKANRMRAFWKQESDQITAKVLAGMLVWCEDDMNEGEHTDAKNLDRGRRIIERLSGRKSVRKNFTAHEFLEKEYMVPNINRLPISSPVATIIQKRVDEAETALSAKAWLSVIFMCGSAFEGILLGIAEKQPELFKGNSKSENELQKWNLAELIDAAYDARLLELDVKKFSHVLRDFRNYIHPYRQMITNFTPTEHTAKICLQVLKAAVANLIDAMSSKTHQG